MTFPGLSLFEVSVCTSQRKQETIGPDRSWVRPWWEVLSPAPRLTSHSFSSHPILIPIPQQRLWVTPVLSLRDAPEEGCSAQTSCTSRQVSVSSLREKMRTSPWPHLMLLVKQAWSSLNERVKIVLLEERQYWIQLWNTPHQIDYNTHYS